MTTKKPPAEAQAAGATARETILARAADRAGASWAKERRDALLGDGRRAVGGWPGTLSEAQRYALDALAPGVAATLDHEERARLARATYASARKRWLAAQDD